jgi:hypothetical protein
MPNAHDAARALITATHRGDTLTVRRLLTCPDLPRIAAALAAWHVHGIPAKPLQPCGTRSAAERHLHRGEMLDDACLQARREYFRERERLRRRTRRSGLDEIAIDRACAGELVALSRKERLAAVMRLRDQGCSYADIAARLGTAMRQVHRDLSDLGLTVTTTREDVPA